MVCLSAEIQLFQVFFPLFHVLFDACVICVFVRQSGWQRWLAGCEGHVRAVRAV